MERRLAAILAADVVGYSRLLEQDEAGTLATLKERRKDILQPLLAQHHGRIVKVMGDGVLVEFASAVNAVQCAVDLQEGMAAANADLPEDRRIDLRIGINLGDVVVEGGDLYGAGVIVAVRLEAMAEPAGICVSGSVHEQICNKLPVTFEDLGSCEVKNIAKPVHVFRINAAMRRSQAAIPSVSAAKPTIAVLPFTNMSGDPEQQYFSDGIAEDIITELSRFHSLLVIARNSSFQYRDKAIDVKRIGRELGVQYVVEGSVRRAGTHIRITAQLIDATTGSHLWANRYDRGLADIFAMQDEVATAIVGIVVGQVQAAGIDRVRRKRTDSFAAYDFFLRGLEHFNRAGGDDTVPAQHMFERAIEVDPDFAQGHAMLALILSEDFLAEKWTRSQDDSMAALDHALQIAQRAVALDGNDAMCHCALAGTHLFRKSFDLAAHHFDVAIQLNPNDADIVAHRSLLEMFTGRPQQALQSLDLAMKLNPIPPNWYRENEGHILYHEQRYEEAIRAWGRATARRPYVYRFLAACHAQMGRLDEARALVDQSLRLQPRFSLRAWAIFEPYLHRTDLEHMLDGLRKAGLPE
jgi:adenylate cyclase